MTTFGFLVVLPWIVGFWWAIVIALVLLVRLAVGRFARKWWWTISIIATAANLAGVGGLYGYSAGTIGRGDGWPGTPVAVAALLVAGLVALVPIMWIWRRRIATPTRAEAGASVAPA